MTGHRKTVFYFRQEPHFLDCEQSLFFIRFNEGSARACERRAAKPRDARNEGGLSCAFSHGRGHLCLVRFAQWTKKKERLLVVYSLFPKVKWGQREHDGHYYQSDNLIWGKQRRKQPLSCSLFDLSALSSPAKPWLDWLKREFLQRVRCWEIFLHAWMSGIVVLANCFAMAYCVCGPSVDH